METFLENKAKKFYADPKVRNAIAEVTAQADIYDTPEKRATVEAEMHFALMNKIIEGKNPDDALDEVVKETQGRLNPEWSKYELNQVLKLRSGSWKVVGFKASGEPILEKI